MSRKIGERKGDFDTYEALQRGQEFWRKRLNEAKSDAEKREASENLQVKEKQFRDFRKILDERRPHEPIYSVQKICLTFNRAYSIYFWPQSEEYISYGSPIQGTFSCDEDTIKNALEEGLQHADGKVTIKVSGSSGGSETAKSGEELLVSASSICVIER